MPSGLQLFNSAGLLQYDSNARLLRWHSRYFIGLTVNQVFQQSVPEVTNDGSWAIYVYASGNSNGFPPGAYQTSILTGLIRVTNTGPNVGTTFYTVTLVRI